MFVIEWIGGEVEKYHSRESWEREIARLKKMGFHENWDFYCIEF